MKKTRWLPVVGFEGRYEISDSGSVRSLIRSKVLKPRPHRDGYVQYALRNNGRYYHVTAHSLVAKAFIGPCPKGHEVRHINGSPSDNYVENLMYGTHKENMQDMVRQGKHYSYFKERKRAIDDDESD